MLKKYRSLDEASDDLPFFVKKLRRGELKKGFLGVPLRGVPYPHGIKKFRTIEEANEERERWILIRSLNLSAMHSKKKG